MGSAMDDKKSGNLQGFIPEDSKGDSKSSDDPFPKHVLSLQPN